MYRLADSLTTSGDFEVTNTSNGTTSKLQTLNSSTVLLVTEAGSVYRINQSITPTSDVLFNNMTTTNKNTVNQLITNQGSSVTVTRGGIFNNISGPVAAPSSVNLFTISLPSGLSLIVTVNAVVVQRPATTLVEDTGAAIHISFLIFNNGGTITRAFTDLHQRIHNLRAIIPNIDVNPIGAPGTLNSYVLTYTTSASFFIGSTDYWSSTIEIVQI